MWGARHQIGLRPAAAGRIAGLCRGIRSARIAGIRRHQLVGRGVSPAGTRQQQTRDHRAARRLEQHSDRKRSSRARLALRGLDAAGGVVKRARDAAAQRDGSDDDDERDHGDQNAVLGHCLTTLAEQAVESEV
jgi:hypothetical protein